MADVKNDLTQAQQDVYHRELRELALALLRASCRLELAGVSHFDAVDTMESAVLDMAERGAMQTLEALDLV